MLKNLGAFCRAMRSDVAATGSSESVDLVGEHGLQWLGCLDLLLCHYSLLVFVLI